MTDDKNFDKIVANLYKISKEIVPDLKMIDPDAVDADFGSFNKKKIKMRMGGGSGTGAAGVRKISMRKLIVIPIFLFYFALFALILKIAKPKFVTKKVTENFINIQKVSMVKLITFSFVFSAVFSAITLAIYKKMST